MRSDGFLLKKLKHNFYVAKAVAFSTYKEWMAYRTHSLVSVFVGPVYYLVQMFIWHAIYSSQGILNGMTLGDMLRYYAAVAIIGYLTMDFADWNLQMLIRTGKYLNFALKPMNHRFFALSQKLGHRTLGLIYEVIPVVLIFIFVFQIPIAPQNWPLAILSVVFSFLINFYVNYSIGLLGFWFTQTGGLRGLYSLFVSAFSGSLIPLTFFPDILQKIILFLPFPYISYVPAMIWTGKYLFAGQTASIAMILTVQGMYVLLSFLLSEVLYRLGQRRFSGVGA